MSIGSKVLIAGAVGGLIGAGGYELTHSLWSLVVTMPLAFFLGGLISKL